MAGLLVSVRSVDEALAALAGRASVVDIKEPANGPLGRASTEVWAGIRSVVPAEVPLSVALGELAEFSDVGRFPAGIRYRKLGLAGSGPDWRERWRRARVGWAPPTMASASPGDPNRSAAMDPVVGGAHPAWIAVSYADWALCDAPDPHAVLDEALAIPDCAGVLVDTFAKGQGSPLRASTFWREWVEEARAGGLLIALAGEIDARRMAELATLRPDLFAVRGAACEDGDRRGAVSADRVAALVEAASRL